MVTLAVESGGMLPSHYALTEDQIDDVAGAETAPALAEGPPA